MVDALASGASIGNDVEVRVLSWAPHNQCKYFICIDKINFGFYVSPQLYTL